MFDSVEVRSFSWSPHQTSLDKREKSDAVTAYEKAVLAGSPEAILARARQCRKLGIEIAVEDGLPVVIAIALKGERHRYWGLCRYWLARFTLEGKPQPDQVEVDLVAACLRAIGQRSALRYTALRCLGGVMASRQRYLTSGVLHDWGSPPP